MTWADLGRPGMIWDSMTMALGMTLYDFKRLWMTWEDLKLGMTVMTCEDL